MARLDAKRWSELKAKWLTGKYSNRDLGDEFGVSHSAIQKKAKAENWEQLPAEVVDKAVDSRVELKRAVSKVAKVSKVETKALECEIDRLASLKQQLEDNAMTLAEKVPVLAEAVAAPYDLKLLAETNSKLYDSHFKQTGVQIAVQQNSQTTNVIEGYEVKELEE